MPTFPSSPLKSRTVSFPQSGFKAGLSDDAFPLRISSGLPSSFVHLATAQCPRAVSRTAAHQYTTVQAISAALLYPRGPRSRRVMLSRLSTLIDPMRPTRQHTPISPHRLIRNAIAVCPTATPQQPASGSVLSLYVPSQHAALYDLGSPLSACAQFLPNGIGLAPLVNRLGTPKYPVIRFRREAYFAASLRFALATAC